MKELTIEEKAKRYDEAIETARKINSGNGVPAPPDWTTCEVIFPELKEPEDERIRKALIQNLKERFGTKGNMDEGLDMPDVLSWLEKQGDVYKRIQQEVEKQTKQQWMYKKQDYPHQPGWRRNSDDNKPAVKHSILMLTTHGIAEGEWLGEEWCQYRWSCKVKDSDVLYWIHLSDLESLEKEIEKQGEQKSEEVDNLHNYLYGEQKPWSEEDEKKRALLISILEVNHPNDYFKVNPANTLNMEAMHTEELVSWLKAIKSRVGCEANCTTAREWSEEDEKILNTTISFLSEYVTKGYENAVMCTDWLKSLKDRYAWKPSELDILLLERMVSGKSDPKDFQASLYGLIEQLKKLKES